MEDDQVKKKLLTMGIVVFLFSSLMITTHAENTRAMKVTTMTSEGIFRTSDDAIYIDSEDIKNLRLAVNTNADILDSVNGMVDNKADGSTLQTPTGSPKIQCEYTAATGSTANHLKITLR